MAAMIYPTAIASPNPPFLIASENSGQDRAESSPQSHHRIKQTQAGAPPLSDHENLARHFNLQDLENTGDRQCHQRLSGLR